MQISHSFIATLAILVALVAISPTSCGQDDTKTDAKNSAAATSEDGARQEILQSDAWVSMRDDFQRWLAMQKIYSTEEITQIVDELNSRALRLSPSELQVLVRDMQGRLEVLLSPQAADARKWVARLLATGREQQVREQRPDVMSMSADAIREELYRFQQRQIARQHAQADFERVRGVQAQAAMDAQAARRQAQQNLLDSRSRAARNAQVRSPYAPRRQGLPNYTDFDAVARDLSHSPIHTVSPWGTPIRWHPLYGYWW